MTVFPLPAEALRPRCDLSALPFSTTVELERTSDVLGQDRAIAAIEFGIGIRERGYNLFVLGPTASGKHRHARRLIEARAQNEKTPSDLVYVHNFAEPHKPRAIELPCRLGARLRHDLA
ncbi:MAG: hypothetical protein EXQ85_00620 [Alphaproteobacteria bacterium]|nr:hypothetical protein [Alphaproteobacteria bacterium]